MVSKRSAEGVSKCSVIDFIHLRIRRACRAVITWADPDIYFFRGGGGAKHYLGWDD